MVPVSDDPVVSFWKFIGIRSAPTAAQFSCMKAVDAKTLESAVNSTGASFGLVADSKSLISILCYPS